MKSLSALFSFFILAGCLTAQPLKSTLATSATAQAGALVDLEQLTLNPGATPQEIQNESQWDGTIIVGSRSWPARFKRQSAERETVPGQGFVIAHYSGALPIDAVGLAVIEVRPSGKDAYRVAVTITANSSSDAAPSGMPSPADLAGETSAAAVEHVDSSVLGRTFAGRLSAHEPIYFIYGSGNQAAKFQFSFKYKLADFSSDALTTKRNTIQFGYTQRSLWDVKASSSPFYDTSYIPQLFWEWVKLPETRQQQNFSWNGFQAGLQHESNGRAGDDSRSLNSANLRTFFLVGPLDGWHLTLIPEFYTYIGNVRENPKIRDYRGYGRLFGTIGRSDGLNLGFNGVAGEGFHHGSVQFDATYPARIPVLNLSVFLLLQYFNGYGESLRGYDQKSDAVRAGISLVR